MPNGPKLLLIDGNNMAHRVYWANKDLSYKGRHTGVLYGFFRQLISLHKAYPNHFRVIVWDGGYARRLAESKRAVEAGLIPSAYKATRAIDDDDVEALAQREMIHEQMEQLRSEALNLTRCLQVRVSGVEADDLINTYAVNNRRFDGESVIISSDQDFYQVLGTGTTIFDAMKKETWTEERFVLEFGFKPPLWVDVGAIAGEVGPSKDNIHGVEGWGPKTACKYVQEYGDIDAVTNAIKAKPKRGKKEQKFLESGEVLMLAKSLKRMDYVAGLPKPRVCRSITEEALKEYFLSFGFASLLKEIWRLV